MLRGQGITFGGGKLVAGGVAFALLTAGIFWYQFQRIQAGDATNRDGASVGTALTISLLSFVGTMVGLLGMGLYSVLVSGSRIQGRSLWRPSGASSRSARR